MTTPEPSSSLHTRLCDVLGVRYPILQAGMGMYASPTLAAAVSQAGGLGIVGSGNYVTPQEYRERIREVRTRTEKPFGANQLLYAADVWDGSRRPSAEQVKAAHTALDVFRRRLGIPTPAPSFKPMISEQRTAELFDVILEERPSVWSVGVGCPTRAMVERCHERGIKVIGMAATVDHAVELAGAGVDAVIAQGGEAGGHRATWTKRSSPQMGAIGAFALVPAVVDAVAIPVIAAGGIVDGRGLAAALALGAEGALMGTRFVATPESNVDPLHRQAIIESDTDSTTLTDVITGLYGRVLRNAFTEEYAESGAPVLPPLIQLEATKDILAAARTQKNAGYLSLWAGQGGGRVRDLPSAAEVVERVVREALETLGQLKTRIT
jgi:nitronate monooxygenase